MKAIRDQMAKQAVSENFVLKDFCGAFDAEL